MGFIENWDWTWPAIVLAFSLGVVAARWFHQRREFASKDKVNLEYFKGLNFLLNEETDKAIEVFIKALEVDSETVELHLALGGLFRRKGQVDRATRIHQNLIARPTLSDEQRLQAIHELAQDYYKAGLLDRAENLFLELKESQTFRHRAISGLCRIYQQEKEWHQAIDVLRLHKRSDRKEVSKQIAHYWCELAETAIEKGEFDEANKCLRSALAQDRSVARAALLRGELSFRQGEYAKAISLWQGVLSNHPDLAQLVVAKVIMSYQRVDDAAGLQEYVLQGTSVPKDRQAFDVWLASLTKLLGDVGALEHISEQARAAGLSGPVAEYLYQACDQKRLANEQRDALLIDLLGRAKKRKIEYTCIGCGFDTKALHWFCPNCGEWESFK